MSAASARREKTPLQFMPSVLIPDNTAYFFGNFTQRARVFQKLKMTQINFCKFHGFGNDYIVIEKSELKDIADISEFSRKICDRHRGVGGDGIAVLEKLENENADFFCEIVNPDGSRAGFSGNGTRCAAAYLYYKNHFAGENLKLETRSGVKNYQLLKREANTFWFEAELGKPDFNLSNPARASATRFAEENNLEVSKFSSFMIPGEGLVFQFVYVDVGNPVACVFVEQFNQFDWRRIGKIMESATQIFPEKANAVFIKLIDRHNIEIRIWERGAGETSSSGTCSIAAAVASAFTGKTERRVSVHAEGGTTEAVWREDDEMIITGRADLAFCGEWFEQK
jgi:diaminopimelate epimerase